MSKSNDNNFFFDMNGSGGLGDFIKPGDDRIIRPVKPQPMYDCPYCDIVLNLQKRTDILDQNQKAFVIKDTDSKPEEHVFLVIPKKHFMDLSLIDKEDLSEVLSLTKKFAKEYKEKNPNTKGFKFVTLQGERAGQTVFHISMKVTAVIVSDNDR